MTLRHRRRTAGIVAVAALSGALLAGCTFDTAGAAVMAGDQRITEAQVSSDVGQVQSELGDAPFDSASVTRATVTRLTQQLLIGDAAQREGIAVTEGQIDTLLRDNSQGSGGLPELEKALLTQFSVPSSAVRDYARTFLEQQALGRKLAPTGADGGAKAAADYLTALSNELDARVAPRYGTWDPATLSLGSPPTDLASPASTPAPAPLTTPAP